MSSCLQIRQHQHIFGEIDVNNKYICLYQSSSSRNSAPSHEHHNRNTPTSYHHPKQPRYRLRRKVILLLPTDRNHKRIVRHVRQEQHCAKRCRRHHHVPKRVEHIPLSDSTEHWRHLHPYRRDATQRENQADMRRGKSPLSHHGRCATRFSLYRPVFYSENQSVRRLLLHMQML